MFLDWWKEWEEHHGPLGNKGDLIEFASEKIKGTNTYGEVVITFGVNYHVDLVDGNTSVLYTLNNPLGGYTFRHSRGYSCWGKCLFNPNQAHGLFWEVKSLEPPEPWVGIVLDGPETDLSRYLKQIEGRKLDFGRKKWLINLE